MSDSILMERQEEWSRTVQRRKVAFVLERNDPRAGGRANRPVSDRHLETELNSIRISAIACLDNILLDTSPQFQAI